MKNGPVQVPEEVKNGPVEVKNGPVQEIFITFYSQKLWRSMSTCWKSWRVYFPMNLVATSLDTPSCLQTRISTDCSEGQQSVVTECWYNLPCKTVQIYNVSWCMAYIAGKLLESSFTPKKRFIIFSHPRNGSSFGLPNKKLWSVYWKLLWRATVTRSHFGNPFRGDLSHCLPSETLFRFHTYLAGLLLV